MHARLIDNGYTPDKMKSLLLANDVCWMSRRLFGRHHGALPVVDPRGCEPYEGMDDLRQIYPDELTQNAMLQYQRIQDYFPGVVTGVEPQDAIASTRGLDVLLRLIRHLFSHMSSPFRRPHEMETTNPFLRLAWSDFSENSHDVSHQARFAALKSVIGDNLLTQPLALEDLIELPVMHRTLWSMVPFVFYHQITLSAPMDVDEWTTNCEVTLAEGRAQSSLAHWRVADPDDLGAHISSHFDLTHHHDGQNVRRVLWLSNRPLAIRVRCDPGRACDFDKLKRIEVEPRVLIPAEDDDDHQHWVLREKGAMEEFYHLVAVVQLASDMDPDDKIQLFSLDHSPLHSTQDKCQLGVEGNTYMLFYVRAPQHQPLCAKTRGQNSTNQPLKLYRDVRHAIEES